MPERGELLFHPIRDAGVLPSLDAMVRYAREAHGRADEPFSPRVYWWQPHRVTALDLGEGTGEGGGPVAPVDDAFRAVLDRATATGTGTGTGTSTMTATATVATADTATDDTDDDAPLDFDGAMDLARALIDTGALTEASAVALLAGDSPDPRLRAAGELTRALVHLAEGNPRLAMKRLQRLGEQPDPDVAAEVYAAKGAAFQARGKRADADAHYRLALALPRPQSAGLAALGLGRTAAESGQEDEAGRLFHTAVGCGVPRVAEEAALELALALERVGRPGAAVGTTAPPPTAPGRPSDCARPSTSPRSCARTARTARTASTESTERAAKGTGTRSRSGCWSGYGPPATRSTRLAPPPLSRSRTWRPAGRPRGSPAWRRPPPPPTAACPRWPTCTWGSPPPTAGTPYAPAGSCAPPRRPATARSSSGPRRRSGCCAPADAPP